MVGGHHLHLDVGRVPVPRARAGPVLPADRRLVDGRPLALRARRGQRSRWRLPDVAQTAGLMHHSDQGCQYTAVLFGKRCAKAGIEISMGSVGDCYDNAVCETFHANHQEGEDLPAIVADPSRGAHRDLRATSRAGTTRGAGTPRSPTVPDRVRTTARRARTDERSSASISDNGSVASIVAEGLRRAHNAPHLDGRRRFCCRQLRSLPRTPSPLQPIPLRPRRTAVKGRTATAGLSAR